jgi:hypothetical protein
MKHVRSMALLLLATSLPACTEDRPGVGETATAVADTTYNPICDTGGDSLCAAIPHMVKVNLKPGYSGVNPRDQRHFDVFSWQSFVALNWPADNGGKPLASFAGNPSAPRVWETYEDASTVYGGVSSPCALPAGTRLLGQMAKNGDVVDPGGDYDEAVGGPLVDRNLNYVLYEKKVNPEEVAYLRANRLNTAAGQYAADSAGQRLQFPAGDTAGANGGPVGAIEIKASWRILQPEKGDDTTRYFTRRGVVYVAARNSSTGRPLCLDATVGLVGMHIAHKTNQFFGAWIWSTFEHVDNAPTCTDSVAGARCGASQPRWSFYNGACTTCVRNDSLHLAGTGDTTFFWAPKPPYAIRYAIGGQFGNQITRTQPIYPETDSVNAEWMPRVKGTVWTHYRLIGSQWMSGDGGSDLVPAPRILRNTTLESYLPQTSSCLGCHQFAYTLGLPAASGPMAGDSVFADFSFLLQMARRGSDDSGLPRFSAQTARRVPVTRHPTLDMAPVPGLAARQPAATPAKTP